MVELSSKFGAASGEAVALIEAAHQAGLVVEGISFHVGSQTTNFENYVQAINLAAGVFREAAQCGFKLKLLDIGGGFPAPYDSQVQSFETLARRINPELDRLFPKDIEILAEPGRFLVATAGTAIAKVIGKARRDGKTLLLHRRRRLSHLFRHHLRPLPVSRRGAEEGADGDSAPSSARPATRWTRFRWPRFCRSSSWAITSTVATSAPTAAPRRPGSTASRRPRWCISIGERRGESQDRQECLPHPIDCWSTESQISQSPAYGSSRAFRQSTHPSPIARSEPPKNKGTKPITMPPMPTMFVILSRVGILYTAMNTMKSAANKGQST